MLLTESKCVTNENLHIVVGPCLDRWQTGPPKAMQREVEDNVLLRFAMEVYETQLALGATSCTNTSGALPQTDRPDISAQQSCWVCWTVPRRPNPPHASSVIRCEALQHNVAQKKVPCVNNHSEPYIVAAPCVRWTHSKKDALLAISLIHASYTHRRNTKSEHMCSEYLHTHVLFRTVFFVGYCSKSRFQNVFTSC